VSEFDKALAAFQAEMPVIEKSKTALITTDKATQRYKYADLADVMRVAQPLLTKHGFVHTGKIRSVDGRMILDVALVHVESGEREVSEFPLILPERWRPQILGSLLTYGRRYCICVMTGIVAETDDDAAAAEAEAAGNRGTAQRDAPTRRRASTGGTGRTSTQRERARPDEEPPLPGEPEPSSSAQHGRLAAHFGEIGVTERDERLRLCSALVGRPLESAKDLSMAEASRLIDLTGQAKNQPEPRAFLLDQVPDKPPDEGERDG